jgi:beta-alanine--pyruvate transaminase
VRDEIYQTFMDTSAPAHVPELFHGYTYSGHPIATAVGLATLEVFEQDGLNQRARELEPVLEAAVHALKSEPGVTDVRNFGLAAAVDLEPFPGQPGLRAFKVFEYGFAHQHLYRVTADTIAMAPPFIATADEIETMIEQLRVAIRSVKPA